MNPDLDPLNNSMQPSPINPASPDPKRSFESNTLQRDRFELLSAYLDGEVTATERKQVEEWLVNDPTVQKLHARLLMLRQGFRSLPVPQPSQPVEQTVEKVFARIERRPRLSLVWGGTAIAALFVGAVTIVSPISRPPASQVALKTPQPAITTPQPSADDGLLVALDQPVLAIPTEAINSKTPTGIKHNNFAH